MRFLVVSERAYACMEERLMQASVFGALILLWIFGERLGDLGFPVGGEPWLAYWLWVFLVWVPVVGTCISAFGYCLLNYIKGVSEESWYAAHLLTQRAWGFESGTNVPSVEPLEREAHGPEAPLEGKQASLARGPEGLSERVYGYIETFGALACIVGFLISGQIHESIFGPLDARPFWSFPTLLAFLIFGAWAWLFTYGASCLRRARSGDPTWWKDGPVDPPRRLR